MRRRLALALVALAFAATAHAQHALDGTWTGLTDGGSSIVLTLAVKDTELTGTLKRNEETTAISGGVVSTKTFTFKATLNDQQELVSGEVAGDEIKAWLDRQGPATAIVLRRSPPK